MLKDDFYIINTIAAGDAAIDAEITLQSLHAIYAGHFPGQPVVPGACMLQMVKEIITAALSTNVQLAKATDIKFVRMVNPVEGSALKLHIQYTVAGELLNVTAIVFKENGPCLKAKLVFTSLKPLKGEI